MPAAIGFLLESVFRLVVFLVLVGVGADRRRRAARRRHRRARSGGWLRWAVAARGDETRAGAGPGPRGQRAVHTDRAGRAAGRGRAAAGGAVRAVHRLPAARVRRPRHQRRRGHPILAGPHRAAAAAAAADRWWRGRRRRWRRRGRARVPVRRRGPDPAPGPVRASGAGSGGAPRGGGRRGRREVCDRRGGGRRGRRRPVRRPVRRADDGRLRDRLPARRRSGGRGGAGAPPAARGRLAPTGGAAGRVSGGDPVPPAGPVVEPSSYDHDPGYADPGYRSPATTTPATTTPVTRTAAHRRRRARTTSTRGTTPGYGRRPATGDGPPAEPMRARVPAGRVAVAVTGRAHRRRARDERRTDGPLIAHLPADPPGAHRLGAGGDPDDRRACACCSPPRS